jgi:hypothetical protein
MVPVGRGQADVVTWMDYMAKDGEVISNLPDGFDDKLCVNIKDEDRKARDAWPEMIKAGFSSASARDR